MKRIPWLLKSRVCGGLFDEAISVADEVAGFVDELGPKQVSRGREALPLCIQLVGAYRQLLTQCARRAILAAAFGRFPSRLDVA